MLEKLTKQFISEPMLPPVVVLLGLVMALEAFSLISSMLMPNSRATTWATCKTSSALTKEKRKDIPVTGMFIPDPHFSSIPDLRSQIQRQQNRGRRKNLLS
jgi:hypothetical protein